MIKYNLLVFTILAVLNYCHSSIYLEEKFLDGNYKFLVVMKIILNIFSFLRFMERQLDIQ